MHQIIPGVLEKNWEEVEKKLILAKTFTNTIHLDIIDGKFVDNKTFLDPEPFKKYSKDLYIELHMMVEEPIDYVEKWADAGIKRFIGHVEQMTSQKEFVQFTKRFGEVGLALDGPTHISTIKIPFDELDTILVYTSNKVGFSGPPLMEERLDKIRHLKKLTNIPIEADGGINDKTILQVKAAGTNRFVATSHIFNSQNPQITYSSLKNKL